MSDHRGHGKASRADKPSQTLQLSITELAQGGDGIARAQLGAEQRVVLVPQALAGERVQAEVRWSAGAWRGRVLQVLEASADRVPPPCPYAQRCGGCDLMHMSVPAQRLAREAMLRTTLARVLGNASLQRLDAPMTQGSRRRVRVALQARGAQVTVGYRAARSHELVPVDRCLVLEPEIDAARGELAQWLVGSRGTGEATIQPGEAGRVTVALQWDGELSPEVFARASQWVQQGHWAGAQVWIQGASEPAVIGDPSGRTRALDGTPVRTAPGGFMQANGPMSTLLVKRVLEHVQPSLATLELFCGAGNITVELARAVDRLEAVEGDAPAAQAARANLAARGLRIKVTQADANSFRIDNDIRQVVLDPPRVGAPGACEAIAHSRVRRVVMVSCDPPTLARDLGILRGVGVFEPRSVELLEMFPHTSHMETITVLERQAKG